MFDPKEKFILGQDKLFVTTEWRTNWDGTLKQRGGNEMACKLFLNNKRVATCNVRFRGPFIGPYAIYNSQWSLQPYNTNYYTLSKYCNEICNRVMRKYNYEYFMGITPYQDNFTLTTNKGSYTVPHFEDKDFHDHIKTLSVNNILFDSSWAIKSMIKETICPKSSRNTYDKLSQEDGMTVL